MESDWTNAHCASLCGARIASINRIVAEEVFLWMTMGFALTEKGKKMADYIKREDAIQAFDPLQRQDWYTPWIVETLKELPPADVAPVRHGRWIEEKLPMYRWGGEKIGEKSAWECSECHDVGFWGYNYCPNCGARMDGDDNEID